MAGLRYKAGQKAKKKNFKKKHNFITENVDRKKQSNKKWIMYRNLCHTLQAKLCLRIKGKMKKKMVIIT